MPVATHPRAVAGADRRTRQSRGQARKDRILAEAIDTFAARGFRGTSVAELAERVGMTHPGLLYYFGTKERLLEEVVATREAREWAGYLGAMDRDSSVFDLVAVADFVVATAVLTRLYHVLAAENLDRGDPLHDFFATRYADARRLVRGVLARDQARGDVRRGVDLDQVAAEVVATLMGLEAQWLMDPEHVDLVALVKGYVAGLRARVAA